LLAPVRARATDEIQVYNAGIAEVGQWTIEQHLNYTLLGQKQPPFPGGLISNHALNGTPELGYGITDWWELGLYAPFAVSSDGRFLSDGAKIRTLFVSPNADKRSFFYGINFEFSYNSQHWDPYRSTSEIRPILGWHLGKFDFIVNPILDNSWTGFKNLDFAPSVRVAYNLDKTWAFAAELYSDYGAIKGLLPFDQQSQQLFGVVDYRTQEFNIEAGLGFGLTPASDRLVVKLMISRDLYKPPQKPSETRAQIQGQKSSLGNLPPSSWSPGNLDN
jgi:hypothetical protein